MSDHHPHGPGPRHHCRFCGTPLSHVVADLGTSPLCESYVSADVYDTPEPFWPLRAYVCEECLLVQVPELVGGEEIYSDYAYFSSYSDSWLAHCRAYVDAAIPRFGLGPDSRVVEIASNDGYLLQYTIDAGIPSLGVEPAANVAEAAIAKGIPTVVRFFGVEAARDLVADGVRADLLIANNVIGHVPAINDFVAGMKLLLADGGTITVEIPHLMQTMEGNQFDQIYQEHYCYWTLLSLSRVFGAHGLVIYDVDILPTHGGSVRIYARHESETSKPTSEAVTGLLEAERAGGYDDVATYTAFGEQVAETKRRILEFLIRAKREGKQIAGYGAPGKGSTLLNYCGIREDFIDYTVDRNPVKQGTYLPGCRIPVYPPDRLAETKPDYIVLLPWNLERELSAQLSYVRDWGGRLIVLIPEPRFVTP